METAQRRRDESSPRRNNKCLQPLLAKKDISATPPDRQIAVVWNTEGGEKLQQEPGHRHQATGNRKAKTKQLQRHSKLSPEGFGQSLFISAGDSGFHAGADLLVFAEDGQGGDHIAGCLWPAG